MIAVALVAVAWTCVPVSFAVAFDVDNREGGGRTRAPRPRRRAIWSDDIYFAVSVMTTFGTTDVDVTSNVMRRTVTVDAVVAFVFSTVILAALVSVLATG